MITTIAIAIAAFIAGNLCSLVVCRQYIIERGFKDGWKSLNERFPKVMK